ncbi:hypothetical protein GP486_006464, partial [Trichoglossum hirsutum]
SLIAKKLFPRIQYIPGPREAITVDEESPVEDVAELFVGIHTTSHAAFANGISVDLVQDPIFIPNLRCSVKEGVEPRAGQGALQSVYVWAMNNSGFSARVHPDWFLADFGKNFIDLDGKPGLQSLVELVQTDSEMCRDVHMATVGSLSGGRDRWRPVGPISSSSSRVTSAS